MPTGKKFGTFQGVFTPSILTILGVIMYLRLPTIIGEAGLVAAIGIILVAHVISTTTGLSVSSIATDKKVQAGGTYYMISRSLGLPIGGTLGLALFVGLSLSVSLYLIGFSESFLGFWGFEITTQNIRITGSIILVLVTILTFISTSLALQTQYFIMAAIVLSLLSIVLGQHEFTPAEPHFTNPARRLGLMELFGIFFPAVTGFEAGVSMSGDLKDPKKSIPRGAILSISVGLIVYILLSTFLAYTVDADLLAADPDVLLKISAIPQLVVAGIWGATLSSALGSILGAPRILQATSSDKISPKIFSKGFGPTREPRNALLLTFVIAEAGILIGELNVIARVVSIFFITTYGFLNLSCAFETLTSADFRPTFKTPAWISFVGAAACLLVMIQLDFLAMIAATAILGGLFFFLKRRELTLQSGDAWSSIWASLVKNGLQRLNRDQLQARNWRPNIIMFGASKGTRSHLMDLGKAFSGRFGILSTFEIVESQERHLPKTQEATFSDNGGEVFEHTHYSPDRFTGMDEIIRVYGFTGVEPNTVLMGWSRREKNRDKFLSLLRGIKRNNFNGVYLDFDHQRAFGDRKRIDIWWSGRGRNLTFAINLIRHLTSSKEWADPEIQLLVITSDNTQLGKIYRTLENILDQYRIDFTIKVVDNSFEKLPGEEIIARESAAADLTMIGIEDNYFSNLDNFYDRVARIDSSVGSRIYFHGCDTFEPYIVLEDGPEPQGETRELSEHLVAVDAPQSRYPLIAEEMAKIDQNNRKLVERFCQKVFGSWKSENERMIAELRGMASGVYGQLKKACDFEDQYRRDRAISRARNEFFFRSTRLLEQYHQNRLESQKEEFQVGIEDYFEKIEADINRFPKTLTIRYDRSDFKILPEDEFQVRIDKLWRRALRPFSGDSIPGTVKYRDLSRHFLRDTRPFFLNELLERFRLSSLDLLSTTREIVFRLESQINAHARDPEAASLSVEGLDEELAGFSLDIENLGEDLVLRFERFCNRMQVEANRNLLAFTRVLEDIEANRYLKQHQIRSKFFQQQKAKSLEFPDEWHDDLGSYLNKVYLDLLVGGMRSRVKDKLTELENNLVVTVRQTFFKRAEKLKEEFRENSTSPEKLTRIRAELGNREELGLNERFEALRSDIRELAATLPEKLEISPGEPGPQDTEVDTELISVPVRRMGLHYMEFLLLGPAKEAMDRAGDELGGVIFKVKDHVSYLRFRLENLLTGQDEPGEELTSLVQEVIQEIELEEKRAEESLVEFSQRLSQAFDAAFEPLASYKIAGSVEDLPYVLREYQGKKALSRFEKIRNQISTWMRERVVRLLYSKSSGELFAWQLMSTSMGENTHNRVLSFVDGANPRPKVMNALPHYYKNLFSGRSAISEEFWVPRPAEEASFIKALERHRAGRRGAVGVIGERNAGKTALCRQMTQQNFPKERIYQVIAPQKGSIDPDRFNLELQNATHLSGPNRLILESLPQGSVIIIHDLELWWERSRDGLGVVEEILSLISDFAGKCLFLVNLNPYAYAMLKELVDLDDYFISMIICRPFEARDLKSLVLRRHQSSGLTFEVDHTPEDQMSEIGLARLFSQFFSRSRGNPGLALSSWLAQIHSFAGQVIHLESPGSMDLSPLRSLPDEWLVVIAQFVLHKRLSQARLKRIMGYSEEEASHMIDTLRRVGLLNEKAPGTYVTNTNLDKYLTDLLLKKELL